MVAPTSPDCGSLEILWALDRPVHAVAGSDGILLTDTPRDRRVLASAPAVTVDRFGAPSFREAHGGLLQRIAKRCRQAGSRRLLNELLVAALH